MYSIYHFPHVNTTFPHSTGRRRGLGAPERRDALQVIKRSPAVEVTGPLRAGRTGETHNLPTLPHRVGSVLE